MASEKNKFQKLTPVHDAKLSIYKDALDFVFENADIKNVAISGAYSAGKSSVIETYEHEKAGTKFLHISLAYFESAASNDEKETPESKNPLVKENVLEGKILNQLIHQIDAAKIPQTNFRVKQPVSPKKSIFQAVLGLLFLIAVLFTWNFDSWASYLNAQPTLLPWLSWSTVPAAPLISCGIVAALLFLLFYTVIQTQKNKNLLKKVSVQGNEIEIFAQSDDSYFDKYLNEVLYLFENSGADAIVFEDMDRYNANLIFQRLREVNTLINSRRVKENKEPIRFFYLLRDDIFVSKDRTKFFDFIIPIVPILDGSNSYDQFIEHFKLGGIFELFDENFLQGISLYVDDMRILKNVYNEFIIYKTRIDTTEQNANKLLALIVYKNLFPRDFSDLQLNKGFVYSLFTSKDNFIEEKKMALNKKISEIEEKIEKIESVALISETEVNFVYANYKPYLDSWGQLKRQYVAERDSRLEVVNLGKETEIEKLQLEIQELNQQIAALTSKKLSEIIDRENIQDIFMISSTNEIGEVNEFKEIKGSDYFDLLKYLIREGFIDETYPDYMTYFYENSLSRIDKVFLRSVTDQRAKEYTYSLQNPAMIVGRLRVVDFEKEETLNFDLLYYLLQNSNSYSSQLLRIIQQLQERKLYDFIMPFIESDRGTSSFIFTVNHQWPQFFERVLEESNYSDAQKKNIALISLYFSPDTDIIEMNSQNVLTNYISNRPDFLRIQEPKIEVLISKFELLQIRFEKIDFKISDAKLWKEVYSHNLYALNMGMISDILENQYHIVKSEAFLHQNFTLILSQANEPLVTYVKANIDEYFKLMLSRCGNCISDSEDVIVYALNNRSISDEHKKSYLDNLSTKISSLDSINNSVWWTAILDNELLLYSEHNILHYFFGLGKKFNDSIIQFINKYATSFSFDSDDIDQQFGETGASALFETIVKCNALRNDKYNKFLSALHRYYTNFSVEGIDGEKVEILIDLKIIRMTLPALTFMRTQYPDQVLPFIVKNQTDYVENTMDDSSFIMTEALCVLKSDMESVNKIKLLHFTDEAISVQKSHYEPDLEAYILEHNFFRDDLAYLLKTYNKLGEASQKAVQNIACRFADEICDCEYLIDVTLLLELLACSSLNSIKRVELFSLSIENLNQDQCKKCLSILSANDYLSVFDGKRPKMEISSVNERILKAFQKKGWITRYDEEGDYYRAIGRKSRHENELPREIL